MVAYCFAPVAGYSEIGSYEGGGSSGNFVYTGFRSRFILLKTLMTVHRLVVGVFTTQHESLLTRTMYGCTPTNRKQRVPNKIILAICELTFL